jgi:heme-degrading monooxygenase HmoA
MILEHAILIVRPGQQHEFEITMGKAIPLISASPGFLGIDVRRDVKNANQFLLLVRWKTIEDHTEGFRKSDNYLKWKALLHNFYDPFPIVEHFGELVASA